MATNPQFNGLPPPPTGQAGVNPNQFSHLPPPPKGQVGINPNQFKAKPPEQSDFLGGVGNAAKGVGNFIADTTGISGTAKAIGGAIALPYLTRKVSDATQRAHDLTTQATKLPIGDPKRKALLKQALDLENSASTQMEGGLNDVPTVKSAAGSMAKLALTAGTAAVAPAAGVAGRIGQGALIGGGFGTAQGIEDNKDLGGIAKSGLIGALVGGAASGLIEAGKWAVNKVPKLLSYASDTPEAVLQRNYDNPEAMAQATDYVSENGPEQVLTDTQGAVRSLRTDLTQQYAEGKQALIDLNEGQRAIFDSKTQNLMQKAADNFAIDLPQDMDNVSVKEAIDLNEEINSVLRKGSLAASPQGVVLRKASDALGNVISGDNAAFQGVGELLSNYSGEKQTLDAADMLVKAYKTSNPIAQRTALSRLYSVYNENAPSFYSAMKDLEDKTGIPIMNKLAALRSSGIDTASSMLKSKNVIDIIRNAMSVFADNLSRGAGRASGLIQKVAPVASKVVPALAGEAAAKGVEDQ